jgi:hypothetical protein
VSVIADSVGRSCGGSILTPRSQVTSYTQEYPGHDGLKGVWGDVFHRMFELTRSNNGFERLGATVAIGEHEWF